MRTYVKSVTQAVFGSSVSAKINGLEPHAYLRHVFTELPKAGTVEAIEALLPGDLDMDQIKAG